METLAVTLLLKIAAIAFLVKHASIEMVDVVRFLKQL